MDSRAYKRTLVILIILVVMDSVGLGWALSADRIHLGILLALGLIAGVVGLYWQLTRSHREILYFFRALENEDTSLQYRSDRRSGMIDELHSHLARVNRNFQEIRLNRELREQYFGRVLEHISSGLIIISGTGHVNQVNAEALRLLNLQKLTHIRALSKSYPGLHQRIGEMKSLDRSELSLEDPETGLRKILGLQVVELSLKGELVKLLTLQDLSAGMERKEIDDWIRLIRVMSHEIMNSLAPITSISNTLKEVWSEYAESMDSTGVSDDAVRQTLMGLDAIGEQSEGLTTFFESYRVLSRIPDPVKKTFHVGSFFEKIETLVGHYMEKGRLEIVFECADPAMELSADEQMIKQVVLNLVKNAVQALGVQEKGKIVVSAYTKENRIILQVADNGEGIPSELSGEIFMPFFTTREKGTGVGLSYSRQVIAMHGGRIEFDSRPGNTRFRLLF